MKKVLILAALAATTVAATALERPCTMTATGIGAEQRTVTVTALTDDIVKVTNCAADEKPATSQTTILKPGGFSGKIIDNEATSVMISPTGMVVTLDKSTGAVNISGGKDKGIYDNGERLRDASGRRMMSLLPTGGAKSFYGAGERGFRFNLAGDTLVMYNRQNYGYTGSDPRIRQMNITMPLLISPAGYALVIDDYAAAEMTATSPISYASESPAAISYYYINGRTMSEMPVRLSELTGRQGLPPFWSLGYITSKYGYKTSKEAIGVVDTLKRQGYPLDGMVLDLYWYGKEEDMGRLEWDPAQWPGHKKMLADLKRRGVNMVNISQPYVLQNGRGVDNYNYLSERGMFGKDSVGNTKEVTIWVGHGGMLDVSNPETRQWLRERYRQLTEGGVAGWWGDLGEPEVHPDGMHHANGLTTRQYHNLYGNDWSRIIFDLFTEEYPQTRLMTLMRGGTTGLQRFNVFPWSTDVSRSWGGLEPQVRIMLNSGLSGLGYMSHDVGGFAIDKDNPIDPELYVRWLQLGTFSPILRTHAQYAAEPYNYPEQRDIILPLIRERYRWLPYNYTLAYQNAAFGLPLVRPIGMYDDNPAALDSISDQYLWGENVMIAPVLTQGATSRRVVFPKGEWVDINNPANTYVGGTEATVEAALETLPMFARAGALIPKADYRMENVSGYDPARYTVDYYPTPGSGNTSFTLFEDDRQSPSSLADNKHCLIDFSALNTSDAITLKADAIGSYPGMPQKRTITFRIHNVDRPTATVATTKIKQTYNPTTRTLTVTTSSTLPLDITLKK